MQYLALPSGVSLVLQSEELSACSFSRRKLEWRLARRWEAESVCFLVKYTAPTSRSRKSRRQSPRVSIDMRCFEVEKMRQHILHQSWIASVLVGNIIGGVVGFAFVEIGVLRSPEIGIPLLCLIGGMLGLAAGLLIDRSPTAIRLTNLSVLPLSVSIAALVLIIAYVYSTKARVQLSAATIYDGVFLVAFGLLLFFYKSWLGRLLSSLLLIAVSLGDFSSTERISAALLGLAFVVMALATWRGRPHSAD